MANNDLSSQICSPHWAVDAGLIKLFPGRNEAQQRGRVQMGRGLLGWWEVPRYGVTVQVIENEEKASLMCVDGSQSEHCFHL